MCIRDSPWAVVVILPLVRLITIITRPAIIVRPVIRFMTVMVIVSIVIVWGIPVPVPVASLTTPSIMYLTLVLFQ